MVENGVSRELLDAVMAHDEAAARELVRRLYPLVVKLSGRIARREAPKKIFAR